ncbi:hypothetical protein M6I34_11260 [Burkholderiaceae bacterium FT117]|uniref:HNH endonuclease n=1 Tax=Zeimonas sediminis TaxID=2944268 RepID=UPI002342C71B|nr:hypothetical protein [Zeimonas sediminis]MCM5571084.1 hypothetical protein [Zeimonas sediminis]
MFTLIPEKALHAPANVSYDALIDEHLGELGIQISSESKAELRNLIINIAKLRGLTATAARAQVAKIGTLKSDYPLYTKVMGRQGGRCIWCGALFSDPNVEESLEHMLPKHIGDDPPEAKNWAIACLSCNAGKRDLLSWATSQFAFDFFERNDFQAVGQIGLTHRWIVLCRDGKCDGCGVSPSYAELFVYKRVRTGLSIPANCSTMCQACIRERMVAPLSVDWSPREKGRQVPGREGG